MHINKFLVLIHILKMSICHESDRERVRSTERKPLEEHCTNETKIKSEYLFTKKSVSSKISHTSLISHLLISQTSFCFFCLLTYTKNHKYAYNATSRVSLMKFLAHRHQPIHFLYESYMASYILFSAHTTSEANENFTLYRSESASIF